jgi:CBS domain-containing protein
MRVREFMHAPVWGCNAATTLAQAGLEMERRNAGALVVVDAAARPIGIVTDRDLAIRGIAHGRAADAPVREVMSPASVIVSADSDLHAAIGLLDAYGVRRLPVVDDTGVIVGIITLDDLIGYLRDEATMLASALASQRASA